MITIAAPLVGLNVKRSQEGKKIGNGFRRDGKTCLLACGLAIWTIECGSVTWTIECGLATWTIECGSATWTIETQEKDLDCGDTPSAKKWR